MILLRGASVWMGSRKACVCASVLRVTTALMTPVVMECLGVNRPRYARSSRPKTRMRNVCCVFVRLEGLAA
jgi:hypothetical protein